MKYLKQGGGSGGTTNPYPTSRVSEKGTSTSWISALNVPYINTKYKDQTVTSYGSGSGKAGVYYNFCAASAGIHCLASSSQLSPTYDELPGDICPSGWKIPKSGTTNGSYGYLYSTAYSSNVSNFRNALSVTLSGYYASGTAATAQGGIGAFWSAFPYKNQKEYVYGLYISDSGSTVSPSYATLKRVQGYPVRCILK